MGEGVLGNEAHADQDGDGGYEAGQGGPLCAVVVGEPAYQGRCEAWDEDAEEDEAGSGGGPVEG